MYTPRPYQIEARDAIFAYYARGAIGNPVVAMPTATGKSLVIAEFCKFVMQRWPRQRIICLTHVKELIEQNAEKLLTQWPDAPLGIFSAGLKQRSTNSPIIYGGVASVVNCVESFGWRDLMLVDEAHLVSHREDTEYQDVIKRLRVTNPAMKVIGFTATPYRTGQGLITDGPIFTDCCYDITTLKEFNKLIDQGYLATLLPKPMHTELDTSEVRVTAGDFNQGDLQKAVDVDATTIAACEEIIEEGFDRKSWLIFASGIEHSEHIADFLATRGIDAAAIHSKMPAEQATQRIKDFRNFKLRAMVNYGKLTTGFDHPPIDLIAILRPTMSTVLWVQMLGRGTRPSAATEKENCLVLDFARNTERLGPINDPVIPRKRKRGEAPGVPPVRICPQCGVYNHARSVTCANCGFEFPKNQKLFAGAGTLELIKREEPVIVDCDVQRVIYNRYQKMGKLPMIKVSYWCNLKMYSEWLCFEHEGSALQKKARKWWRERTGLFVPPPTTDEALKYVSQLAVPKRIKVVVNRKYPEILSYEY
jgi:DNA repair protein RadD